MKIIIVTENFPPCAGGGIAEWAMGVSSGFSEAGHNVTVLTRWRSEVSPEVHQHQPFRIHVMHGRNWRMTRSFNSSLALVKHLIQSPDAVVIATTWELGVGFRFLSPLFPDARQVLIAHGKEVTQLKNIRRIRCFRKTLDASQFIVAVSRFTEDAIRKQYPGYPTGRIHCVPNGVDVNRFRPADPSPLRNRLGVRPHQKVILTLARVIERKGHDTVLKSLPRILRKHPDTVYVIAGPWKTPFYESLQSLIHELGLIEHVLFTGFVEDADLNMFYSLSDVYVMVSREADGDSEGFGITFLEAGACGCPVIGSRSGGIADAVEHGVNGFLVEPDDPDMLAETIVKLFDDPAAAKRIGAAGRKRINERLTWTHISQQLIRLIENGKSK